jgi:hypothetical protein
MNGAASPLVNQPQSPPPLTTVDLNGADILVDDVVSTPAGPALIADTFYYNRSKQAVHVMLTGDSLKFYNLKNTEKTPILGNGAARPTLSLAISDLAGSIAGRGNKKNDTRAYLTVYAYPQRAEKGNRRHRVCVELAYGKCASYEENLSAVSVWHRRIDAVLKKKIAVQQQQQRRLSGSGDVAEASTSNISNLQKPYLVFVNPVSGAGKAKNIYFERIVPVWAECNQPDTLVFTSRNIYSEIYYFIFLHCSTFYSILKASNLFISRSIQIIKRASKSRARIHSDSSIGRLSWHNCGLWRRARLRGRQWLDGSSRLGHRY